MCWLIVMMFFWKGSILDIQVLMTLTLLSGSSEDFTDSYLYLLSKTLNKILSKNDVVFGTLGENDDWAGIGETDPTCPISKITIELLQFSLVTLTTDCTLSHKKRGPNLTQTMG